MEKATAVDTVKGSRQAERKADPRKALTRGSIYLTDAIWELVRRDAALRDQSEAYILREIAGQHYKLPKGLIHPPRRRGGPKQEADVE